MVNSRTRMRPGAGAGIVSPFGLEVIDEGGELAIGLDFFADEIGDDFFVGHGENHVTAVAILEASHFVANLIVAFGFFPDGGGVDDGHGDFLSADFFHFFADDGFDFVDSAFAEGHEGVDACAELADEASAEHELVADGFGVCGCFSQGLAEEVAHFHFCVSPVFPLKTPQPRGVVVCFFVDLICAS